MPLKDKDPLNLAMADHCGIDVSKNELVVGFYPSGVMFKKTNSDDGRADIADMLATLQPPLTIVESTGGYQKPIVEALYDVGIPVAVVNPRQTSQFSAGVNQPAKTDELDAVMLARFGSHVGVRLYEPPSQVLVELRSLIIRREDLVRMRTREKLRSQMANYHRASSIQKTLAFLGEEIEEIEGRISTTISSREEWIRRMEILRSVPGVGLGRNCVHKWQTTTELHQFKRRWPSSVRRSKRLRVGSPLPSPAARSGSGEWRSCAASQASDLLPPAS